MTHGNGSQCPDHPGKRIWRMRIINKNTAALKPFGQGDPLKSTGHFFQGFNPLFNRLFSKTQGDSAPDGRHNIVQIILSH